MRAHLFDADGVIFDSEPAHAKSYVAYARSHRIDLDEDEFLRTLRGNSGSVIMRTLFPDATPEEIEEHTRAVNELFRTRFLSYVTLTEGFERYVERIESAGHSAIIVSNGVRANLHAMLEEFSITIPSLSIEDFTDPKPAPTGYLRALDVLGVRASEGVVYEDSEVGILAARRAGLRVVGIASFLSPESLRAAGAHTVIRDFTEIQNR